ncbi:hypothetical protein GRN08_1370 [Salmonella phage GRNsp8]|uniref:Uncharacterized protein n=1 Tax=Salmonella phage GRNsp8 TaxID=2948589 RepID=A0A9E7LBY9_9CAUD|nr:hypothetical protein GRN08_1370 [Salmonella phage GRNsp8]
MFDFDGMTRDIVITAAIIVVVSFLLGLGLGLLF